MPLARFFCWGSLSAESGPVIEFGGGVIGVGGNRKQTGRSYDAYCFWKGLKRLNAGKEHSYFSHRGCEYFPCHPEADPENFNCLFCYCPLYLLGPRCGGNFVIRPGGRKDCSGCLYPHQRESYEEIVRRYGEIAEAMPDK